MWRVCDLYSSSKMHFFFKDQADTAAGRPLNSIPKSGLKLPLCMSPIHAAFLWLINLLSGTELGTFMLPLLHDPLVCLTHCYSKMGASNEKRRVSQAAGISNFCHHLGEKAEIHSHSRRSQLSGYPQALPSTAHSTS